MQISEDIKKKVLEVFVTSAEDAIYALNFNIPPEVFGAFGSFYSRNPKDFREHLWDAITGQIEEQETDISEESLRWLADRNFREPFQALKKGLAKSQDFFKKWYGKYSHKSIANTVWIPTVATNVSQLFARELAYDQLAFFIEQSTRYVVFDAKNVHKDKDVIASKHKETYEDALEEMANCYKQFIDEAALFYKQQTPYDKWLKYQKDDTIRLEERLKQAKYNREIRGQALDVARFLLPQATKTNIAWILDARSTEFDIAAWKGHPLEEIVNAALLIEKHAGQIAPSLLKYTEKNDYYSEKLHGYNGMLKMEDGNHFGKEVEIIDYHADGLDKVIAHILKRHNRGGIFHDRYGQARKMSYGDKINILRRITEKRGSHDEWIEVKKDLDLVKMTFEIKTDVGAVRDWRRHQKNDRGEALYTLDNGYHKPYMLDGMSTKAKELFDKTMHTSYIAERAIRNDLPYQAQYLVPMAANHAITMSAGLDQIQYMIYTRSTVEGNFSYRQDAFNLAEAVAKKYPWLLGLRDYPRGKNIKEVYKDAPLKTIIKLDTRETGLHT